MPGEEYVVPTTLTVVISSHRLRHEKLKRIPKDVGGPNAYQTLTCYELDDTPALPTPPAQSIDDPFDIKVWLFEMDSIVKEVIIEYWICRLNRRRSEGKDDIFCCIIWSNCSITAIPFLNLVACFSD